MIAEETTKSFSIGIFITQKSCSAHAQFFIEPCNAVKSVGRFIQDQIQALIFCFFVIKNKEGGRRRRGERKTQTSDDNGNLFSALRSPHKQGL